MITVPWLFIFLFCNFVFIFLYCNFTSCSKASYNESTAQEANDLAHLALRKWLPKRQSFPRLAGHLQSECYPGKVSSLPPLSRGSEHFPDTGGLILNV